MANAYYEVWTARLEGGRDKTRWGDGKGNDVGGGAATHRMLD
jgi:hypothetical protein